MFESKHSTNSRESFVSGIAKRPLLDSEENFDSLLRCHGKAFALVSLIGFLETVEDANDLLHILNSNAQTTYSTGRFAAFDITPPAVITTG